jgi:hypothetical protein
MSSNQSGSRWEPAVAWADDANPGSTLIAEVAPRAIVRDVVGDRRARLACAAAAMERVGQEIDDLWRSSMTADDDALSERLAEVSHALQRAGRLLEQDMTIG